MRSVLKRELQMPIVEMRDPKGTLDGGDVLWTGREFFVGISNRTNEPGARCLADAFPEYPVTPIKIPKKLLHLKSVMSMAGPDIICISSSPEAQEILKQIEREATYKYYTLTVPDDAAANVLYVNGSLVHRSEYPVSNQVFQSRVDYSRVSLKLWELSKPQAYLTSLCVLIKKSKTVRL